MKIGTHLISLEFLSIEQAERIIEYQLENPSMMFGEIAVKLDYIKQEDLDNILESK